MSNPQRPAQPPVAGQEALQWLFLAELLQHNAAELRALMAYATGAAPERGGIGQPQSVLEAGDSELKGCAVRAETRARIRQARARGERHPAWQRALRQNEVLQNAGALLLALANPGYPRLLSEIYDPPPLLYLVGDPAALRRPQFAVVGSRRCSAAGERAAEEFAAALVGAGFSICSGLALGIDAAAHRATLAAGGATVAVMATGIDLRYPRRNQALAEMIAEHGVLLTEFPPGAPPRRQHFPQRNRVISGLSVGVLVVEASLRSGSLITARMAAEQNREVFAVPHSIFHPGGRGCLQLLRDGAGLAESVGDVLGEIETLCRVVGESSPPASPAAELLPVWNCLGYEPRSVDSLVQAGAGDVAAVTAALAELEIAGLVEQLGGSYLRAL